MRRVVLLTPLVALCLAPAIASAKLPFFGLEVATRNPDVGEPITLTMTCFGDQAHTRPWSTCFGTWDRMAWVHPLDDEGQLDRSDWIPVKGRATASGAARGTITLDEPGSYDVLPLRRTWRDRRDSDGFPGVIRIEVGRPLRIVPMTLAALGIVGTAFALTARRRTSRATP